MKSQVNAFKISLTENESNVGIHVPVTPNLDQEGSYIELTKIISEEVKQLILNTTYVDVGEISFTFESAVISSVKHK